MRPKDPDLFLAAAKTSRACLHHGAVGAQVNQR